MEAVAREAGAQLGLRSNDGTAWGRWNDLLVRIQGTPTLSQIQYISMAVMLPPGTVLQSVNAIISNKDMWKNLGLKHAMVRLDSRYGIVSYILMPAIRKPKVEDVLDTFRKFTTALKPVISSYPSKCEKCGRDVNRLILVNNIPVYMCDDDLGKLQQQFTQVAAVDRATKPRWCLAIAMGLLGAVLGVAIWAGIGLATGRIFYLVGLVNGFIVVAAVQWGAKKVTGPVILMMILFALFSTFLGVWLWITAVGAQLGYGFDLINGLRVYFIYVGESGGEAFLDYFFTLVPILFIASSVAKRAKAVKPKLDIQV